MNAFYNTIQPRSPRMEPGLSITQADIVRVPWHIRFRWRLWLFVASPFLFMGGCSLILFHAKSTYLPSVMEASSLLHEQLARGEIRQIFLSADPAFQAAMPATTTLQFLTRVRRKLGACQYTGPTSWSVNTNSSGTFVTVFYHGQCANGAADETLRWKVEAGVAHLMAMHMNSPLLLTD